MILLCVSQEKKVLFEQPDETSSSSLVNHDPLFSVDVINTALCNENKQVSASFVCPPSTFKGSHASRSIPSNLGPLEYPQTVNKPLLGGG